MGESRFEASAASVGRAALLFLRVSIGGPADLEARARRARELATYAVARLPAGGQVAERPAQPAP